MGRGNNEVALLILLGGPLVPKLGHRYPPQNTGLILCLSSCFGPGEKHSTSKSNQMLTTS